MSDHISELLGPYLDGELAGGQLRKVEVHLGECQVCREELEALQALSFTLRETELPDFLSAEQMVTSVMLELPRKSVKTPVRKTLEIGWWLAPIGLLTIWIFINTGTLVSEMLSAANGIGLLKDSADWLAFGGSQVGEFSALLGQLSFFEPDTMQWLSASEGFIRNMIAGVFWQLSIAMLYLSWMAIWWARTTLPGHSRSLER
jgi:hypothetical protein